jgi:hypothetical protein
MAADISKQQSELQAINSQLDSLKQQVSVAEQAEKAAYAARDAAAQQYPVASLLQQKIAADKALLLDPNSPAVIAAQQKAAIDFQTAKAAYAPYVDAADKATANTIATRSPYVDAQTKAGELEVAIVKADPTKTDAYPEAAAYIKENETGNTKTSPIDIPPISEQAQKDFALNQANNPSGKAGANIAAGDNGATTQTFDDGSTLTTYKDGTTKSTDAPAAKSVALTQAETDLATAQQALDQANTADLTASTNLKEAQAKLTTAEETLAASEKTRQDRVDYRNQLLMEGEDTSEIDALIDESDAEIEKQTQDVADAKEAVTTAQNAFDEAQDALDSARSALAIAQDNLNTAQNADTGESVTNPTSSTDGKGKIDGESAAKDQKSRGLTLSGIKSFFGIGGAGSARTPLNSVPGKPVTTVAGFGASQDMRVKLRIPSNYLVGAAGGPNGILGQLGGILFPYTPQVSIANQATYQQSKVTHSNYQFYNFQNSSVGPISVTGKFTAQNEYEAAIILSVQHVLRALTKMKWGDDQNAGAPPPICRFDAFGDYQMKNIPVAVADFKVELPDQVDYIAVGRGITGWGNTMVPTSCNITMTLNVMYSRQEAQYFGVDKWLQGQLAGKGYL